MFFDLSSRNRSVQPQVGRRRSGPDPGRFGSVVAGIEPKDPTAGCAVGAAASAQVNFMNQIYTKLLGITVSGGVEIHRDINVNQNISCQATGPNDGLKLDAGSWRGLAATDVTLGELAAQLGFADADALMASQVTQKQVLTATANALKARGTPPTPRPAPIWPRSPATCRADLSTSSAEPSAEARADRPPPTQRSTPSTCSWSPPPPSTATTSSAPVATSTFRPPGDLGDHPDPDLGGRATPVRQALAVAEPGTDGPPDRRKSCSR